MIRGHRIHANEIPAGRFGLNAHGERLDLLVVEIVHFEPIAIHQHGSRRAVYRGATTATVVLLALTAHSLPSDHAIRVFEIRDERVVELPVVVEMISPTRRRDARRHPGTERPAAHIDFMRAVIERLTGAVMPEPVPVVWMHVVGVRASRCWPLKEIPVERRRYWSHPANTDRFPRVRIPRLGEIRRAYQSLMNPPDDLDRVRGRALLIAHLDDVPVLLRRGDEQFSLVRIVTAGLLDVHVLARLQRHDRHRRMPVVGRRNRDRINIALLEQATNVFFLARRCA